MVSQGRIQQHKKRLIARARKLYRTIAPCGERSTIDDCFTVDRNRLIFWFNTADESTHMMSVAL